MTAEIARDRYGRPLVIPPEGGKPVPYARASSFGKPLEDTFHLDRWRQRMVALGLSERPDLQLGIVAHRHDKSKLNNLCGEAIEAAKGSAAATTGTALHALTERLDRGEDLGFVPAAYRDDIDAYAQVTAGMEMLHIEQFVVCDELRAAGTPDRVVNYQGRQMILDLKTGRSVDFNAVSIAVQLSCYANSVLYDPASGERFNTYGVDHEEAIVIHAPAGTGSAFLYRVDIEAGWAAAKLAAEVTALRKRKDLMSRVERMPA